MCCSFSGLTTSACISHIQKYYCRQRRFYCSDVLMPPQVEGDGKSYPPKIQKLVQEISKLTLMEVADLNELLKVISIFLFRLSLLFLFIVIFNSFT